jgi:hypothetical protein
MSKADPNVVWYEYRTFRATQSDVPMYVYAHDEHSREIVDRYSPQGWEHDPDHCDSQEVRLRRVVIPGEVPDESEVVDGISQVIPISPSTHDPNDPAWLDWYPVGPSQWCVLCGENSVTGVDEYRRCPECREGAMTRASLVTAGGDSACKPCGHEAWTHMHPCDRLRCRRVWSLHKTWAAYTLAASLGMPATARAMSNQYVHLVDEVGNYVAEGGLRAGANFPTVLRDVTCWPGIFRTGENPSHLDGVEL